MPGMHTGPVNRLDEVSEAPRSPTAHTAESQADPARRFRLIFTTVVALTVLALILDVVLALIGSESEKVRAASETCATAYKMGFGAIVALLGGRAL